MSLPAVDPEFFALMKEQIEAMQENNKQLTRIADSIFSYVEMITRQEVKS